MVDISIKKQTVNPATVLVRNHTIPIQIKKIYSDVDGIVIDKNTIPANLQVRVPVFLLGEFDRLGGYSIGLQNIAPDLNLKYLMTFVNGFGATSANVVGFSGVNTVQQQLKVGDIVTVFTDDILAPSYFIWIVVQNNYSSIASIVGNMKSIQNDRRIGPIIIHEINYRADNDLQLGEGLQIVHYSNIGTWKANQIDPLGIYRTPFDVQTGLVRIVVNPVSLDQYIGINTNMLFASDVLTMDLKIKTY